MAQSPMTDGGNEPRAIDPSVASPARVWNYWVGGKDHFAADREAAGKVLELLPHMMLVAQLTRRFLIDTVHQLAAELGIRQFLDIGTGLPTADNTHDVAQRVAPESRIVYVDNDPVVISHAQALLTGTPAGVTDYLDADLRDPATILAEATRVLDFSQPVAVLLIGVLRRSPSRAGSTTKCRRCRTRRATASRLPDSSKASLTAKRGTATPGSTGLTCPT